MVAFTRISSKIKSYRLYTEEPKSHPMVQSVDEKLKRPTELNGTTYRLKTPLANSALYVTINDIVLNKGTPFESRQPFEIFINSKEMENFQWVVALTRLVSAIFRKGGDIIFIVEELKSVFDPGGGYLSRNGKVPSLVAEIGLIVERHFKSLGLIEDDQQHLEMLEEKKKKYIEAHGSLDTAKICPSCGAQSFIMLDNCPTCVSCGHSKCG